MCSSDLRAVKLITSTIANAVVEGNQGESLDQEVVEETEEAEEVEETEAEETVEVTEDDVEEIQEEINSAE